RQFEIADPIDRARYRVLWIALNAEQKLWINEHSLKRRPDTCLEPTSTLAGFVKTEQRPNVFICHRPAISAARERRKNFPGTGFCLSIQGWLACEDSDPAWSFAHACRFIRSTDRDTFKA